MERREGMHRRLSQVLPALLGAAVAAALFGHLLDPSVALVSRDVPFLHLPLLSDLAALARQGAPLWNPWLHGGQPVLSNPHYAAFYPPTWLGLLLPAYYALDLLVVLHAALAFLGAWKLARHLGCASSPAALAGIAFTGGGAFVASADLFNLYCGLAWLPWAILWGDRCLQARDRDSWLRSGTGAALAIAAQALTGSPVTPVLSGIALACLSIEHPPRIRSRIFRLGTIGMLALALSAIQLAPTVRRLWDSPRVTAAATGHLLTRSTPPWRFLEWVWPRLHGEPMLEAAGFYFGYPGLAHDLPLLVSLHCGYFVLALALGGLVAWPLPRRRALGAMLAVGVLLALGRYNPLYSTLLVNVPPFSVIRFPEKFVLLSTTAIALLAALAWNHLLELRRQEPRPTAGASQWVAVAAVAASLALLTLPVLAPEAAGKLLDRHGAVDAASPQTAGASSGPAREVLEKRAAFLGRETFLSLVFWIGTLALLLLHRQQRLSETILVVSVLAFVACDFLYYGRHFNTTVSAASLLQTPAQVAALPAESGRVFSDEVLFHQRVGMVVADEGSGLPAPLRTSLQRLVPYTGNLWGLAYALNEDTDLMLTHWARHALFTFHLESGLAKQGFTERVYRFLGAWNIATVVRRRSPEALSAEHRRTGAAPDPVRLVANPFLLPRYRFVAEVAFSPDLRSAVGWVSARDFDLASADAVVSPASGSGTLVESFTPNLKMVSLDERPHRVMIDYEARSKGFLVAAITYDRDWQVTIDGEKISSHPTALGQIGIELPAGGHRLTLRYRDPAVAAGAALSLVALVACVIARGPRRIHHHG